MIPPRQREAEAFCVLIDLFLNGPDEFGPEHWDTGEAAARVADEWRRRAKIGEPPVKRQSTGATMRSRKASDGPTEATRQTVQARSRGFCEVGSLGCRGPWTHLHHRLMRSQGGGHGADNLLGVCANCHDYIHAHPAYSYERGWLLHRVTA